MFNRNIIFHKRTEEFTGLPIFISSGVAIIQNIVGNEKKLIGDIRENIGEYWQTSKKLQKYFFQFFKHLR